MGGQFHTVLFDEPEGTAHFLIQKLLDATAVLLSVHAVAHRNFLAGFHPQHMLYMVYITSRDPDVRSVNLGRVYKKSIHLTNDTFPLLVAPGKCSRSVVVKNFIVSACVCPSELTRLS